MPGLGGIRYTIGYRSVRYRFRIYTFYPWSAARCGNAAGRILYQTYGRAPFDSLKISHDNLVKMGYGEWF